MSIDARPPGKRATDAEVLGKLIEALPDAHTDFIFAVIGEEYGVLACLALVLLFVALAYRAFAAAWREPDHFARLAVIGLGNGLALGVIAAGVAWGTRRDPRLGLVLGMAMVCNMFVAATAGTIGYELMCALAPRVPVRVVD